MYVDTHAVRNGMYIKPDSLAPLFFSSQYLIDLTKIISFSKPYLPTSLWLQHDQATRQDNQAIPTRCLAVPYQQRSRKLVSHTSHFVSPPRPRGTFFVSALFFIKRDGERDIFQPCLPRVSAGHPLPIPCLRQSSARARCCFYV